MGRGTKIEWADNTFNPWIGCSRVHTGCLHCYAEAFIDHRQRKVRWGVGGTRRITSRGNWQQLVGWNRDAGNRGQIETVFMASMADIFEDFGGQMLDQQGVKLWTSPQMDANQIPRWYATEEQLPDDQPVRMEWVRSRLLRFIRQFENLHFLILTKRPGLVPDLVRETGLPCLPENCSLGTSVSDQGTAESFVPDLVRAKDLGICSKIFISYEPAVGGVDWDAAGGLLDGIDWLICGGESSNSIGPAREFRIEWAKTTVAACSRSGVPCFVKQLGSNATLAGQKFKTIAAKGDDPLEWPESIRIQERLILDRKGAACV
jgi:protein gp37